MESLLKDIENVRKSRVKSIIDSRLREFTDTGRKAGEDIFSELCFCILTANYSAAGGMKIQQCLGRGFLELPENELVSRLKELGHRFPNARADYIIKARELSRDMANVLKSGGGENEVREWFVKNVRGLGYKEASHFLRNIGYSDLAIIDFHIIDILERHGLIKRPKTLTKKRYIEIENVLRKIAEKLDMSLAELDLYLWYMETGKVLK